MLHFKPRMYPGTKVSTWKAINETKNRGKMIPAIGAISTKDFNLLGIANEETTGNGIRLSYSGVGGSSAGVWWKNEFYWPMDITYETYISGAADGIVIYFQQVNGGSLYALGGSGGNIGFIGGSALAITQDQWNNGQPVPYLGWHDGRSGMGYPGYYVNISVNDGQWHKVRITVEPGGLTEVYWDGVKRLSAFWKDKMGFDIPNAPVWTGATAATGAATQNAFIRRVYLGDERQDLYRAPNYSP